MYPSYRGEIVNDFDKNNRENDPNRIKFAYKNSLLTKNLINNWNNKISKESNWYNLIETHYNKFYLNDNDDKNCDLFENIYSGCLKRFENNVLNEEENLSPIYSCHEGLHLNYESSLTHLNSSNSKENISSEEYYNLSAEMIWLGERTRQLTGAHVEYFRGINNPIGVKISTKMVLDEFCELCKILNPKNEKGKLLLILRLGNNNDSKIFLKKFCDYIIKSNINCPIISDPMHGNGETKNKIKTRNVNNIMEEINFTKAILEENGLKLNGIHLESTPFDVTECFNRDFLNEYCKEKYTTKCDPRLNMKQVINLIKDLD